MSKIYILGIGPGHRDYLLKKTEDIIKQSNVLIGGSRALKMFADLDKEKVKITADLEKIKNYILDNFQNKMISVLVSGDPGLYSLMNYLKRGIDEDLLKVIPGISSMQLAAARVNLNWQDMKVISLHGKDNREKAVKDIKRNRKVGIFTDNRFPPDKIASLLIDKGIKDRMGIVFERLSYPDERIIRGSLEELQECSFARLTVMIILKQKQR